MTDKSIILNNIFFRFYITSNICYVIYLYYCAAVAITACLTMHYNGNTVVAVRSPDQCSSR